MDRAGLITNIYDAVVSIDLGRKGFAIKGKEQEGRIFYEKGIALALANFIEAQASADPQILIIAEYTFVSQELHICSEADKDTLSSLSQAVQSFDDAFLALKVVEDSGNYHFAEKTYPNNRKYRISGFPKDAFHIACISHKTRIQNILRTPGVDPIEKDLLKQRLANLSTAQSCYIGKQKKAMGI